MNESGSVPRVAYVKPKLEQHLEWSNITGLSVPVSTDVFDLEGEK